MPAYITLTDAQVYFDERLNIEAWEDCDDTRKGKALSMATRILDRLNYVGCKTDENQVNEFPRGTDTTVPLAIQEATAELALALLDGIDPETEFENLFLTSQGYANVRSTYNRDVAPPHIVAGIPSIAAWRLIRPFLRDPHQFRLDRVN